MSTPDIRATAIANEVYQMLVECAANSGIAITDLIRELQAKQSLMDMRVVIAGKQEAAN